MTVDRNGPENAEVAALLAASAGGDRAAFQRLYERTSPTLLGCLVRILRDRALAEDALQEVYIQVWNRAGQFEAARGSAWAWLVSIARYRAIDLRRRESHRAGGGDIELDQVAADTEPHEGLMSLGRSAGVSLERCLGALQVRQRECIVLAYEGGLTHSEVAVDLGESLGTVKSWIRRGLAALKRCLES